MTSLLKGRIAATLLSGALKLLPNLVASSSSMSRVVRRVAVHLWRIQPHVHVLPFKDRTKKTQIAESHRQRLSMFFLKFWFCENKRPFSKQYFPKTFITAVTAAEPYIWLLRLLYSNTALWVTDEVCKVRRQTSPYGKQKPILANSACAASASLAQFGQLEALADVSKS